MAALGNAPPRRATDCGELHECCSLALRCQQTGEKAHGTGMVILSGVLWWSVVVLVGCTSLPPVSLPPPDQMQAQVASYRLPYAPADGEALVCVVRPSPWDESHGFNVFLDAQDPHAEMGVTLPKQYIYFSLTPGDHRILSKAEDWAEITVSVKAGDILFLQQEPTMGMLRTRNKLLPLHEVEGKYHVQTLTLGTLTKPPASVLASAGSGATPARAGTRSLTTTAGVGVRLPFPMVVVRQVTQANGVGASPAFLQYFAAGLREELAKAGVARQVTAEGPTMAAVDGADTVVLEGKLIGYKSAWYGIVVKSEIVVYRPNDNTVLKTMTSEVGAKASPLNTDRNVGENTGKKTAHEIRKAMD